MRKHLLFFLLAMILAGRGVAQDVYSSGYFNNSSNHQSAGVWKNGVRLHYVDGSSDVSHESTDVVVHGSDHYWVDNATNSDGFYYGDVFKNGTRYLSNPTSSGSHIYALAMFESGILWSVGCTNIDGRITAARWMNNITSAEQLGNAAYESRALGACTYDGYVYSCGYQYTSNTAYKGVIWKGTIEFVSFPSGTRLFDITFYRGAFYVVGTHEEGGTNKLKVWTVPSAGGTPAEKYTLSTNCNNSPTLRYRIHIEAGDIFVNGRDGGDDKIWKNGTQLYTTGGFYYSVIANTNGVYYAGREGGNGKIWKDGSVLYSPANAERILSMYIAEPECQDDDVRSLPFTEGFENGSTSWPCWTKLDVDNNNAGEISYWTRGGEHPFNNSFAPATGDYCAYHRYGDAAQEGWLISPKLFLQPGRDNTRLTFKSNYPRNSYYYPGGCSVWISTTNTNTSSFTKIWEETSPSSSWSTKTIDLAAYQGQAVYIAFKFVNVPSGGGNNHCWLIDDISVTESWEPCGTQSVPYSYDFNGWNLNSACWYVVDNDKSGDGKHWKYDATNQCAYHPWGPSGVYQYGCLVSPNINLPAGHDYVLKFKTKSTSSGSGMANKVWIKLDGTGTPDPDTYTTRIWSDTEFSSSWTEVEVPLSSYAGHNISFSFEYEGTYAHNWYIDDVRVEESIAQYTITANANNNAWGTVSGGGTYNAGATCSLSATPASGYQFQSWKKNGTVVSTNANYSFTVSENATYTAYFGEIPINYYHISTNVTPAGAGSVSGGGTHQEGSTITLTATANAGYTFSQWQDGNTDNPRTVTVTSDATYTATFTQQNYTVSVTANPAAGGSVTGGGTYHYGDAATLSATANSGYDFQGWDDGVVDNPRTVTVTGNATYTAIFSEVGAVYYSITTNVTPAGAGSVSGGGTYEEGTTITLTATANTGYTFDRWSDGSTQNPRTVTVNTSATYTAQFVRNQYTITVNANPASGGSVSGSGTYHYGDAATLRATPYSGYDFVGWSDGSTENPHVVTVTGNATYTATFSQGGATYYTVSAVVNPANAGTVSGTGSFAAGTTTTLRATANAGYTFDRWNDGNTQNPRIVTVNSNMSFTAHFTSQQYTITTAASPAAGGSVTGGGSYAYNAIATLTATANTGYTFMQWSDGNRRNPRSVRVTENATYTAVFLADGGTIYTLTVTSAHPELGSVVGGGTYPAGTTAEISAHPNANARFVKWSDGNTENPRSIVMNSNVTLSAEFAESQTYTIVVNSANDSQGQAFGGGEFAAGTEIEITAIAYEGYVFSSWNDGNTSNPRTVVVNGNATYTAQFSESSVVTYTLTLISNTDQGTVSGGGVYVAGTSAFVQAFPNPGYTFVKWSDENTDNPREIAMTQDLVLVAFFNGNSIDENGQGAYSIYPNPTNDKIRIEGLESACTVEIYNVLGVMVREATAGPDQEISVGDLASGLYMVRFGNVSLRFVKTY